MGFFKIAGSLVILGVLYIYVKVNKVPQVPVLEDTWWGPGKKPVKEDIAIRPFKIEIHEEVIKDLYLRLDNVLPLQAPLEGVNHNYGINTNLLNEIVEYWKTKYNWKKRQEFLNQFPQFETTIQGLKIHYIHVKPKSVPKGVDVLPLLLVHGWPGSIREFYEMIPLLTTLQKGRNFIFEVIVPSLPGYGFSDASVRPGMGAAEIGQIFYNLMSRLKFDKYYLQGGDWGSAITMNMAIIHPEKVLGLHRNACFDKFFPNIEKLIGILFPSLLYSPKEIEKNYPLGEKLGFTMLESGYFHIQATKPDTVGVALRDSPVGLAAYIIEKFITWTNPKWKDLPNGGLTQKFTYDQLLDNVMIYWVTRSIITSARLYAEAFSEVAKTDNLPIIPPSGCNRFEHEISYPTERNLRKTHVNLIHLTDFEDGGHFAAFELPEVLSQDIYQFVDKVRTLTYKKSEL